MKNNKFHWIDDTIKIDFPVPKAMQILMNECEQLDLDEDYAYFNYIETLDCDAKELVYRGILTEKQWDIINTKYRS